MTRMNPTIKAEWISRLRSGEYTQAKAVLREAYSGPEVGGFCCLGVLCEIAVEDDVTQMLYQNGQFFYGSGMGSRTSLLPDEVQAWAGIQGGAGLIENYTYDGDGRGHADLADINDSGKTFAEIADIIEEYL